MVLTLGGSTAAAGTGLNSPLTSCHPPPIRQDRTSYQTASRLCLRRSVGCRRRDTAHNHPPGHDQRHLVLAAAHARHRCPLRDTIALPECSVWCSRRRRRELDRLQRRVPDLARPHGRSLGGDLRRRSSEAITGVIRVCTAGGAQGTGAPTSARSGGGTIILASIVPVGGPAPTFSGASVSMEFSRLPGRPAP